MLQQGSVSAFDCGTVRVGDELSTAEPLWIEPYTAVAVAAPVTGGVDVYASFDGVSYFVYAPGAHLDAGFMRSWKARIPARWLKFVGVSIADADPVPDGTLLQWGAKS